MPPTHLFHPALAMVALTFVVWLAMYFQRVGQMKRDRIHPQAVATAAQSSARLTESNRADNFRNLFEGSLGDVLAVWFNKIIGILATTIAAAQGAPFWFDLLNRARQVSSGN